MVSLSLPRRRYEISAKQWNRIFDRTVERDAGAENWPRLELYLDETAFPKARKVENVKREFLHRELAGMVDTFRRSPSLESDEIAIIFDGAFHHYESLLAAHSAAPEQRAIKSSLIEYLFTRLPALSKSESSLRRVFDMKLAAWRAGGRSPAAITDQRHLNSGNHREQDFAEDLKKIRDKAWELDGNESLAHRMLRERGELSPEFCGHYAFDIRSNKSYVPRPVRDAVTPLVEAALPLRHSERALQLAGPHIHRVWSDVQPGDWFNADDVTWNHYYRIPVPGGWDVIRGECLFLTDLRTGYPIDYLLIAGHYNSGHIRRLMLRGHDSVGLPSRGFYLERGVWAARMITGKIKVAGELNWSHTYTGLAGLNPPRIVRQAWLPRAKPIEGLFHIIQDRMREIPGFVGFNEREEKREGVQKMIAQARRNDPEALAFFPTMEQWRARIDAVLKEYSREPQNGHMLDGASPAEAWEASRARVPLQILSGTQRHILATHGEERPLTLKGIVIRPPGFKQPLCYANEDTGRWLRSGITRVVAFYNFEQPDAITVSDLKRQNFITVNALIQPGMDATNEQRKGSAAMKRGHLAGARIIASEIKHRITHIVERSDAHDEATDELGRHQIKAQKARRAEVTNEDRLAREIRSLETRLGLPAKDLNTVRNLNQHLEGLRMKAELADSLPGSRNGAHQIAHEE